MNSFLMIIGMKILGIIKLIEIIEIRGMVILGTMIHGTMTTSSKKDYLSILGLSPDFDDKELKKAFRREARKWHPDLNK